MPIPEVPGSVVACSVCARFLDPDACWSGVSAGSEAAAGTDAGSVIFINAGSGNCRAGIDDEDAPFTDAGTIRGCAAICAGDLSLIQGKA